MDFESLLKKFDLRVEGVLHAGAHLAEEAETYWKHANGSVWWVEANPAVIPKIKRNIARYPDQYIIQALVYEESGVDLAFNVTNYDGMSSSILEFGTHPEFSPDTVFVDVITLRTTTIDDLVKQYNVQANLFNMDLQGAELHALKGAEQFLDQVDYIMTEINEDEVYKDCARVGELDEFLSPWGFDRVETALVSNWGWGDALYIKNAAK